MPSEGKHLDYPFLPFFIQPKKLNVTLDSNESHCIIQGFKNHTLMSLCNVANKRFTIACELLKYFLPAIFGFAPGSTPKYKREPNYKCAYSTHCLLRQRSVRLWSWNETNYNLSIRRGWNYIYIVAYFIYIY